MPPEPPPISSPGRGAAYAEAQRLYGEAYYRSYRSASGEPYGREGPWLAFFASVAQHIVDTIGPRTVLDVGCAKGFLVEALRDLGVEAYGVDISEYAVATVRTDIAPYCWVGSAVDRFPRRYDLIVCIEVLEHLPKAEADRAVANMAAFADDVLFSSTPEDDGDPTHVNVQPIEAWSEAFARQGMGHDLDFDATFIAAHAMRFRQLDRPYLAAVSAYERALWRRNVELAAARRRAEDWQGTCRDQLEEIQRASHRVDDLVAENERLDARLRAAAAENERLDARLRAAAAENEQLGVRLVAAGDQRTQVEEQLRAVTGERDHLASYVALIKSTAGWMVLERLRSLRARVAPADSGRHRTLRRVAVAAKTLMGAGPPRDDPRLARRRPSSGQKPRILIVSGAGGAMERYRCDHACAQLRLQGLDAEVCSIGEAPAAATADYDVVLCHRVAYDRPFALFVEAVRQRGAIVLIDFDDLVFDPEVLPHVDALQWMSDAERDLFLDGIRRYRESLALCDGALVTTEALAEAVRRQGRPAWVHRNAVSAEMLQLSEEALTHRHTNAGRIVVGYASGTRTHNRDFLEAEEALERILVDHPNVDLWVVGPLDLGPRWGHWGDRVKRLPLVPWRELPAILARFDVSLSPLEHGNPFCEAKSELKYIEASAVAVPTVASDIGAFRAAIRHGDNGLLASDTASWVAALEWLISDDERRRRMGAQARADVLKRYHPAVRGPQLVRSLDAAARVLGRRSLFSDRVEDGVREDTPAGITKFGEDILAHAVLGGLRGLEIGAAAHNPLGLDARNVALPASWERAAETQRSKMGVEPVAVHLWASGDNLPVGAASQDFVVSSHVVEHMPDLLGAFREWDRVVRDGGYVYMIVPHQDALAEDAVRELTSVEHFIDDHRAARHTRWPAVRWAWRQVNQLAGGLLERSAATGAGARDRGRLATVRSLGSQAGTGLVRVLDALVPWDRHSIAGVTGGRYGHYHTFTPQTILALVEWMRAEGLCDWELVAREDIDGKVGNGFTLVFRVCHLQDPPPTAGSPR